MYARVTIDVAVVDRSTINVAVDIHVAVTRVHIDVRDLYEGPRARAPSATVFVVRIIPAVVVHATQIPITIVVQPSANRESHAERPVPGAESHAEYWLLIDDNRIVHRYIDHPRLRRYDDVIVSFVHDALLRRRCEIAVLGRHRPHALHGGHDVAGLIRIRTTQCRHPVRLGVHHVERRRVMRDGLHADIPRLVVDTGGAVRANVAGRIFNLIGKCRRDEHLGEQGVGIQGDWPDKVIELVGGISRRFVGVLGWRHARLRERRIRQRQGGERERGEQGERSTDHCCRSGKGRMCDYRHHHPHISYPMTKYWTAMT